MLRSLFSSVKKKYARRGVVLMYHRIADTLSDPWELAVSPQNFEEQLQVLKAYNVILKDKIPANTAVVTFDDGYRDNYLAAKPLLEKHKIPATFFITTDQIGKQQEFWWDALERICLQSPNLPDNLILEQPERTSWSIGNTTDGDTLSPFDLYLKLCAIIRKMPAPQQQVFIKKLELWANNTDERPGYFTMDKKELLDLQSNPLFTIGGHTMTHPFLPDFSCDYQKTEIQGGIAFLEELTGEPIEYLAYPHGGRDQNTLDVLPDSGVALAFTTDPQYFTADTYKYAVPRFQVNNWNGKTFAFHLNNWMKN
jgi:peptidoglycan/xylan/chitin deacetylase (PgdA/CDA1 family)